MPRDTRPIIVFADDFGRHPSNSQHLATCLAERRRVLWVNTIGTRRPRLSIGDARRAAGKLAQWLLKRNRRAGVPDNITVINPVMWPDFASRSARAFNARSISRAVNAACERLFDREPVVLTTLPITADVVGRVPAARWVYYAVDDWSSWPGLDHDTLARLEAELLERVDATAAVSQPLMDALRDAGHDPVLIDHGIDLEMWRAPSGTRGREHATVRALESIPGPRAVFWGLIDERLDGRVLDRLVEEYEMSVALVGPKQDGATLSLPCRGVHRLGGVPRRVLPAVAAAADVLVLPYVDSAATRACQPLKLKEYLATDRAVVAAKLPSTRPWSDCCDVVPADRVADRVAERAFIGPDPRQLAAREAALASESWQTKAGLLERLLDDIEPTHDEQAASTGDAAAEPSPMSKAA